LKYEVIIYWSEPDKAFIAEVPELPGCMADGKSHASALKAVDRVMREWIDVAKSLGRPVPKPRGRLHYA
jgi:predicted RNase H-like HicB family nuclease